MANPTAVIFTDANGKVLTPIGATSGAQAAAPTPVVLCDANGNALSFTGSLPLPSGSTATTQAPLDNSTKVATTAYADAAVAVETSRATTAEGLKANLASPALTGSPTAPTQAVFSNDTKLATDAYADALIKGSGLTWFRDDFLSCPTTAFTTAIVFQSETPWVAIQIVASCTPSQSASTFTNQGQLKLTTGAVSGNGGALYKGNGAASVGALNTNAGWEWNAVLTLGAITNIAFRAGFVLQGQEAADTPTDGIWVRFDTTPGDTLYTFECRAAGSSAGSTSTTNSIAPVALTFAHLKIRSTVAGTILFSVNGGTETAISTNVPTGLLKPFFQVLTRTASAQFMTTDLVTYVAANGRA